MEQERILPTHIISGTTFIIDVQNEQLRELGRPDNIISFNEMAYSRSGYRFDFNKELKNIPVSFVNGYETIHLPNMTELDPLGMAQKYGISEIEIIRKKDVDIMVDQQQLAQRERGQLPVIEIKGHLFYVDLVMDSLRPKDDFATAGIRFNDIDDYFLESSNHYRIPYNPATHSFEDLDYENIKAIPKGIIIVDIPWQQHLDPIAYARIHGFDKDQILRESPIQLHMKAHEASWDDTPIKQIIAKNLKRDLGSEQEQSPDKPQRKRGRGL
ncbi:hypothetical protein SAMN05216464_110170 [Mucilaginibacter pineti]|uniref:Uncharacterized protein n=1 Tax=Mucilaginibacter pineti TaxID=1391627 RepID=A0A1G7GJ59_9SPHI|nr:hypothetical protein [Mucilaginibacter pineti]SDE88166.1 hypothetical protein SAMN05216464_110170 [Mucilaginibacter pineti]